MNLVIVESPSKAKTINKYLGKGYIVKASKGHVIDLPKSNLGVDVNNDFKADYVVTKKDSLSELKKAYKGADKLILAVDMDREGEAIGWHIASYLGAIDKNGKAKKGKTVERIVFTEITKSAIDDAVSNPRNINRDLVNAQQARRILDRLVGYKLSPILWKKIMFGLSAGRVQSAALRLIVEREEERNKFNPDEYWSLNIFASKDKAKNVEVKILKSKEENEKLDNLDNLINFEIYKHKSKPVKLLKESDVHTILDNVKSSSLTISSVDKKVTKRYPKPPFITSTLQQAAVNMFGFTSKRTMQAAQKLYEAGFITYMRTDSVSMSAQAIDSSRKFIKKKFGDKYLPAVPNLYKTKSKNAQEAHECIRPADFSVDGDSKFTDDQKKVYTLIRNRALASQMTPAEVENVTAIADVNDYQFKTTGSTILFDGYLKLKSENVKENILPTINKGEIYHPHLLSGVQHFTQPPARYSEASLIKKLEELEIGRPSTYASIISTILSRKYVEKEGRYLFPTDTGIVVNRLLVNYFPNIVDYEFTSGMEKQLDSIAEGNLDWLKMLKDFYFPFEKELIEKEKNIPRDEFTVIGDAPEDIKCPVCGSAMKIKLGRYGRFYSCSKWPDCKGILSIDGQTNEEIEKESEDQEFKDMYEDSPKTDDGRDYKLKKGKFGKFWAHPDYPKVKDAQPLKIRAEKLKEVYGEVPQTDDGRDYLLRSGRFGEFWAHPDYPKVKDIKKAKKVGSA